MIATLSRRVSVLPVDCFNSHRQSRSISHVAIRDSHLLHAHNNDGFHMADEGWVPARRQRRDWTVGPGFHLAPEEAVEMQLQALQTNNEPCVDHGVEVLYRFAAFDPFERSCYFGTPSDLGQFERFRRVARDKPYDMLLWHHRYQIASSLQISEYEWSQRVRVYGAAKRSAVFTFHMRKRSGGHYDGVWFTEQLLCDRIESRQKEESD